MTSAQDISRAVPETVSTLIRGCWFMSIPEHIKCEQYTLAMLDA